MGRWVGWQVWVCVRSVRDGSWRTGGGHSKSEPTYPRPAGGEARGSVMTYSGVISSLRKQARMSGAG